MSKPNLFVRRCCDWLKFASLSGLLLFTSCDSSSPESHPRFSPPPQPTAQQAIANTLSDPSATTLHLDRAKVTDRDLQLLINNSNITSILIDSSGLSDEGLIPLTSMENLVQLRIRSRLTDAAVPLILNMESLRFLNLPQADFTDLGIEALSAHPNIQLLRIGGKRLSNKSLESIATMSSLSFLHLIAVPIDNNGLPSLYGMQDLQSLYLDDTKVTDAGLVELLNHLPRLHLHINQNHIDRDPNKHNH